MDNPLIDVINQYFKSEYNAWEEAIKSIKVIQAGALLIAGSRTLQSNVRAYVIEQIKDYLTI